jgi:uncharacterized protein
MYCGKVKIVKLPLAMLLLVPISVALLGCTAVSSKPTATLTPKPIPSPIAQAQTLPLTLLATINQKPIKLAVAETPMQQQIGLMYRTLLPDDEGMLFKFEPARPVAFWMKQTLIPLDMLYIRSGVIREIQANVPPCTADPCPTYPSTTTIDQVIEIRGGLAEKLGIKVGDRVTLTSIVK